MTDAERFQKAMQAILSVPPKEVEEINRQVAADYSAIGRQELKEDRAKRRASAGRNREGCK